MSGRGNYLFLPPEPGTKNGQGVVIPAGPQLLTWTFRWLTPAEYLFWHTTLLGGALSVELTAAELWDHKMVETVFTSGNVHLPRPSGGYRGGLFWGVTVHITDLLPYVIE